MIRVADYILKRIYEEGVKHLFYVPGGQCVYLMDALRRSEMIGIAHHHEQAAAMAALSYSQYNGNFGACLVTTGCAGTNTITGVLHAWQDSIPCIFISGQQNPEQTTACSNLRIRQIGIQEANIVELVTPITKYAVMITDAKDVAYEIDKAIFMAKEGRKGPVWLDIPLIIQNTMVDEETLRRYEPENVFKPVPKTEDIDYVLDMLNKAKRPIVIAGQGIRSAGAVDEFRTLIEALQIPTAFTRAASDYVGYTHKLNLGVVVSTGGERAANFAVQNSDLVLNIGCRLSTDTIGSDGPGFARNAKIIVVDIDEEEHKKPGAIIEKFILADAKEFINSVLKENLKPVDAGWVEKCQHWKNLFRPYGEEAYTKAPLDLCYFLEQLSAHMPEHCVLMSDAGTTGAATPTHCHLKEGDRIVHSIAQGEMGYAFPGAIGVACAHEGTVVSVSGDGSFMMNLQELQTLVRNQFNIKIIIINNNGYSGVRHGQKAHFRGKSIGTDPSNGLDLPSYEKIANAFGVSYGRINNPNELDEELNSVFADDKPYMCEVMCDPDQIVLHNALVQYGKRKFGFRPIEDQSPFLDRETFFREMIVEPDETSYGKPV